MIILIIAHPDDEILWAYGVIALLKVCKIKVNVICLTNGSNSVRKNEFISCCKSLGLGYALADLPDTKEFRISSTTLKSLIRTIQNQEPNVPVSAIISHSPWGEESGHSHHVQVFHAVADLAQAEGIGQVFFADRSVGLDYGNCVNKTYEVRGRTCSLSLSMRELSSQAVFQSWHVKKIVLLCRELKIYDKTSAKREIIDRFYNNRKLSNYKSYYNDEYYFYDINGSTCLAEVLEHINLLSDQK